MWRTGPNSKLNQSYIKYTQFSQIKCKYCGAKRQLVVANLNEFFSRRQRNGRGFGLWSNPWQNDIMVFIYDDMMYHFVSCIIFYCIYHITVFNISTPHPYDLASTKTMIYISRTLIVQSCDIFLSDITVTDNRL